MRECEICGKEFKDGAGLQGHKRLVHPGGPSVDGKKFLERLDSIEEKLEVLDGIEDQVALLGKIAAGVKTLVNVSEDRETKPFTKKDLLGENKGRNEENEYHCSKCNGGLQNPWAFCPGCGAKLNWNGM